MRLCLQRSRVVGRVVSDLFVERFSIFFPLIFHHLFLMSQCISLKSERESIDVTRNVVRRGAHDGKQNVRIMYDGAMCGYR